MEGLEDEISLYSRMNSNTFTIILLSGSGKSYQNKVEVEALLNTLLGLVICVVTVISYQIMNLVYVG